MIEPVIDPQDANHDEQRSSAQAETKSAEKKADRITSERSGSDRTRNDVTWGIPETNHLPYEDQPSPGTTDKQKSGAV